MNTIKALIVGETTESIIRAIFIKRIALESNSLTLNSSDRALKIKELQAQILGFIKRNHNGTFELIIPEYNIEKN